MTVTVSGGDKFGPVLKAIVDKLTNASTVQVGFDSSVNEANGTPVALVAMLQEFGAPSRKVPPRPFFRTMVAEKSPEWPEALIALVRENGDAAKSLGLMGEAIKGQLFDSINDFSGTPLSAVTVMLRGMRTQARYRDKPFGDLIGEAVARVAAGKTNYGASTKPLDDTGTMLHAIISRVE